MTRQWPRKRRPDRRETDFVGSRKVDERERGSIKMRAADASFGCGRAALPPFAAFEFGASSRLKTTPPALRHSICLARAGDG